MCRAVDANILVVACGSVDVVGLECSRVMGMGTGLWDGGNGRWES